MGLMIFDAFVLLGECFLVYMFVQLVRDERHGGIAKPVPFFDEGAPEETEPVRATPNKVTMVTALRSDGGKTRTERRMSETGQAEYPCSL
jgi:hypothetical protein